MVRLLALIPFFVPAILGAAEPDKTQQQINRSASGCVIEREFRPFVSDGERVFVALEATRGNNRFWARFPESLQQQKLQVAEIGLNKKKIRVILSEPHDANRQPMFSGKRLTVTADSQLRLTNTDDEKASDFAPNIIESHVIPHDDIEVMQVRYELLADGKPTSKYLALAPLAEADAKKAELRELILGTKEQAITIMYKHDRGTSGK
jgi:hypothetical protein